MAKYRLAETAKHYLATVRESSAVGTVGLRLLVLALLVGVVGFLNQHGFLYLGEAIGHFLQDFYANLSTELASIAITVLVIDVYYQHRETEREKRDLILQMGSPDNAFAREAIRKLRVRGWLEDGSLVGAYLDGANLTGAWLGGANLFKADLLAVNLDNAYLERAVLSGAYMTGAKLSKADLNGANLIGVVLIGAYLTGADLRGADLRGADLRGADLSGAYLEGAIVTDEQLAQARTLEGATMPDGTEYSSKPPAPEGQPLDAMLKMAREQAGLTQKALAEQVRVSRSTVGRWEREGKMPDTETRAKVAEVLGIDPWDDDLDVVGGGHA
ncbi:MAG: pentapeptide repeat-containing protein [Chloroflexota bacterium]